MRRLVLALPVLLAGSLALVLSTTAVAANGQSSEQKEVPAGKVLGPDGELHDTPPPAEGGTRSGSEGGVQANSTAFGTSIVETVIPAFAFKALSTSSSLSYNGHGYAVSPVDSYAYLFAPLDLPTGAVISEIYFNMANNSQQGAGIWLCNSSFEWDAQTVPSVTCPAGQSVPVGSAWSAYRLAQVTGYVNTPRAKSDDSLLLAAGLPAGGQAALHSVSILWQRTISPAPASPAFSDVPVDHGFYQHIGALAASNITTGCGSGKFCPDNPVTRGQMAVFLSKALGLHYPES